MAMLKFVPLLAIALMIGATVLRGIGVQRRTGVSPWAFLQARGRQRVLGVGFTLSFAVVCAAALLLGLGLLPPMPSLTTGALLTSLGVALLIVAQVQMGAAWRVGFREGDAPLFVNTGLYRFSRNPIFLGMIIIALGTALAAGMWWAWGAGLVFAVVCHLQVRGEEEHLAQSFGAAYNAYTQTVPRWIGIGGVGL